MLASNNKLSINWHVFSDNSEFVVRRYDLIQTKMNFLMFFTIPAGCFITSCLVLFICSNLVGVRRYKKFYTIFLLVDNVLVTQRAIIALNLLISGAIKSNSLFYIQLSVLAHPHGSTDSLYWL